MTVNDQEPRYQLVDSAGNKVGTVYVNADGDMAIQEGTNQNEATLDSTGTWNVPTVATEQQNNEYWIKPGTEINTRIQDVGGISSTLNNLRIFKLHPGEFYYISNTIDLPQNTGLDLNGATIRLDSDIDVVKLNNNSTFLSGPGMIYTPDVTFTSRAVSLDTSTFTDNLSIHNWNTVGIYNFPNIALPSGGGGTAVELKADGQHIVFGNRFDFVASHGDVHMDIITDNGGYVSDARANIASWKAGVTNIRHRNTAGAAGPGVLLTDGEIEADSTATNAILNEIAGVRSIAFNGDLQDVYGVTDIGVKGEGIAIRTTGQNTEGSFSFDVGQTVNGVSYQALGGVAPDATNWRLGNIIHDTDNPGDLYLIYGRSASGDVTKIGT